MSKRRKVLVFTLIYCLVLLLTSCQTGNKDPKQEVDVIPGVGFDVENPLEFKRIYIKIPATQLGFTSENVPNGYNLRMEVVEEANKILEEKINTVIDIEYIPYVNKQEEILKKLNANDQVDVIDYRLQDPKEYIKDLNIADLTDLLPVYYPELMAPDVDLDSVYTDGRIYQLPRISTSAFQQRTCLVIDREFYKAAKEPSVETMKDVMALYKFGIEHENEQGDKFLDGDINRHFICPFFDVLRLCIQENGYTPLAINTFFAVKDGEIIDLFETDIIENCYHYLADMYSQNALSQTFLNWINWAPRPNSKLPGLSMALTSFGMNSYYAIKDPDEFNRRYVTMFIGEHDPYSYKTLHPIFNICDNGNADRSVIACRYMYENKELNQMLTYGVEGKHYKFVENQIENIWHDSRSVFNWWPSIVNDKFYLAMDYAPEGAEQYVKDFYDHPKQVISGVNNGKLNSYVNLAKADQELNDAMERRQEVYETLYFYEKSLSKGIPYEEIVSDLGKSRQRVLLEFIKEHINNLKG